MKTVQIVFAILSCVLIIQGQDEDWKDELFIGNCKDAKEEDLVLYEHVEKEGLNLPREALVIWHNEEFKIYCVTATNLRPTSGCQVKLDGGGIGEDFVRLDMVSLPNNGLEFNVTIYATRQLPKTD